MRKSFSEVGNNKGSTRPTATSRRIYAALPLPKLRHASSSAVFNYFSKFLCVTSANESLLSSIPPLAHERAQLANTTCTPRSTIVAHGYMHARVNESFLDTYLTAEHSGADALRLQTSYLQLQATAMV